MEEKKLGMKKKFRVFALLTGITLLSIACSGNDDETDTSIVSVSGSTNIGLIDDKRILQAESEPGNWLAHGRTYEEQRFSPLKQINKESISDLGLVTFVKTQLGPQNTFSSKVTPLNKLTLF